MGATSGIQAELIKEYWSRYNAEPPIRFWILPISMHLQIFDVLTLSKVWDEKQDVFSKAYFTLPSIIVPNQNVDSQIFWFAEWPFKRLC